MIWAFLCGLLYGSLLQQAWKKAQARRFVSGMNALFEDIREVDCSCDECCGCGEQRDSTAFDLYAMTHTGYEDS